MQVLSSLLAAIQQLAPPGSRALAILKVVLALLVVLVPIAMVVGAFLYMRWKKRKEEETPAEAPLDSTGAARAGRELDAQQLKRGWDRFCAGLPAIYRRSILNFEHFVVLGAAAAGKSRLIDGHTDWRRQAKQFLGSQTYDPDLQVHLASTAVVMEIPERILTDHGARCQAALRALWKPLYRRRSPTIVVVFDAVRLLRSSEEAIVDQAETMRAKINLLSSLRDRRLEVRVVLTHLDQLEGYAEFARFCQKEAISTRFQPTFGDFASPTRGQVASYLDGLRAHLPRALLRLSAEDYRKVVSFLRRAPELVPSISRLLDALFSREALSRDPVSGGVYLVAEPPGVANPLRAAAESGPGPDPQRIHLMAAVAGASALITFFALAYRDQRSSWAPASAALENYHPADTGSDSERVRREDIIAFTRGGGGILRHPDFFAKARRQIQQDFAEKIRVELLVPNLKKVASGGSIRDDMLVLPSRRSLYYLAVIHSDHTDGFRILRDGSRMEIWASMTGLDPEIIRDYLRNRETPHRAPIEVHLPEHDVDLRDTPAYWMELIGQIRDEMADGVVRPTELRALQARAAGSLSVLDRYQYDELTATILDDIDSAARTTESPDAGQVDLRKVYLPKFQELLDGLRASNMSADQRAGIRKILRTVQRGAIDVAEPTLLRGLVDRLGALYGLRSADAAADDESEVVLRFGNNSVTFDPKRWREIIRDSTAGEQIAQFVRGHGADGSIFFARQEDAELRPVVWNPTNDGSAIFVGRGTIEGRYTRVAFERHVRDVVGKLGEVLDKAKVPDDQRRALTEYVRGEVRRYATEYRAQLLRFQQAFGLRAQSQEALRIAIAQMSSDVSPFNDYLVAIDRNAHLDFDNPLLEPMRDALADFASFHNVVDSGGGSPELAKYKAILAQMLVDLSPQAEAAGGAAPVEGGDTLEKTLSPAGRIVLAGLRGDKGSYSKLVGDWVASVHLAPYQAGPFLSPIEQLTTIGRADIERVVRRAWERDMLPDVLHVAERFPFDPDAQEEITPKELAAAFHPVTGRFFDFFRRYIEPLSEFDKGGPFRQRSSFRTSVSLPGDMYPLINAAASLSARLWDPTGKPLPLATHIWTVPFPHGTNPHYALTLVYLNVGDASVFNFNQQPNPSGTLVMLDWTREQTSQVGAQLTDLDSKENTFPDPIVAQGSFWSFLRLVKKSQSSPVRQPAGATLFTWNVKLHKDGADVVPARFVVLENLWEPFTLGTLVRTRLAKGSVKKDG